MKSDIPKQNKKRHKKENHTRSLWVVMIFVSTVLISAVFSMVSGALLSASGMLAAFCILLVIILIGILFDVLGVAVTAADPKPFHSMAAHRVRGAQEALGMLRQADKVSSFCNAVIGDICGVVSGAAAASIAAIVLSGHSSAPLWLDILMAALVSGVTVGGKAMGKSLAINKSTQIVILAAKAVYYLKYMPRAAIKVVRGSGRNKQQ